VRTVAITGAKGGTGKTTTAVNLAAAFALDGLRVLLRDLDPQASATLALGQERSADPTAAAPVAIHLDILTAGSLTLYPGGRAMSGAPDNLPTPGDSGDVLVLDCPPALAGLTLAAIRAADLALVTLQPAPLDLPAFRDLLGLVEGMDAKPQLRAVLTRADLRHRLSRDVIEHLDNRHPGTLYPVPIPEDVRAREAPGYGLPVVLYAPGSRSAEAYRQLAREVAADLMP
jgi:chromosome partitioning protein